MNDRPLSTRARITLALVYAAACHGIFALAGLAMLVGLFTGMQTGFGQLTGWTAWVVNILLLAQFPLGHSFFLSNRGRSILCKLAPYGTGKILATTTYATIASLQLLALFTLWSPSGVILWQASGPTLWLLCVAYAVSWVLLTKASFDAGPTVQAGSLGWMALLRNRAPVYPDMPEKGLFRVVRQPIYVSFALVLWCVPVWTPDQLLIATSYTAYCILAPRLKERRFERFYGDRFRAYRARVPYWLPRLTKRRPYDA
ncbi:MAG: isoprenylcysteine carboxylmethyltransferase family protein [Dinoroseobacter sp.]|nr:isoprenylcysteine carboxylmethyltransferase family protein [Dinoroseobacter sp.]